MRAFFTVHRDLPREGPGLPEDVIWALQTTQTRGAVRVMDAACGPGADLVTLANALPDAEIHGIEKQAHFVEAARALVAGYGDRVMVSQGDMATLDEQFDLIWCAGALYFLGVTAGLQGWRGALRPGGKVVFSEPEIVPPLDPAQRAYWEDYPALTDAAGIRAAVEAAGYRITATRRIIGAAWEAYYAPMEARLKMLRAGEVDAALEAAIAESETEIALWKAAPDRIAYSLVVAEPTA